MTGERGYTLVELVISAGVMLLLLAAVMTVLHDGLAAAPVLEAGGDLHQRVRVAADAIGRDVAAAAAGTRGRPLSASFAAVVPRAGNQGAAAAHPDVLTVRYAPAHGATGRLRDPLAPAAEMLTLDTSAACPADTVACGFLSRTLAVVFDETGQADLVSVDAIAAGALTISAVDVPRVATYPAGTPIAEVVEVTYSLDAAARQLRRREGGAAFVLADGVTHLAFEYFDGASSALALGNLTDGPFRGAGRMAFDEDLLRIRTIRASLRLETGIDSLRGSDPALFVRPGRATGRATVPDMVTTITMSVRNGGRVP